MSKPFIVGQRVGLIVTLITTIIVDSSKANTAYSILDLGVSGRHAKAGAINDVGHAAFFTHSEGILGTPTQIKGDAFFFDGVTSTVLTGVGVSTNEVWDINNHDHAIGWADDANVYTYAVKYVNGIASPIGIPDSIPSSINDTDQITGWLFHHGGNPQTAFFFDPNLGVIDLGTLGGSLSTGYGINNHGVVVGSSDTGATLAEIAAGAAVTEAFQYRNGVMTGLGTLGGHSSSAYAINDRGEIVGEAETIDRETHAFLFDVLHGMQDVGMNGTDSTALDINNQGEVVGRIELVPRSGDVQAFLYDQVNGMRFLEDLIPANSGWQRLIEGQSINNRGQILGTGFINHERHVFLMTPVPEPMSLATVLFGILVIIAIRNQNRR